MKNLYKNDALGSVKYDSKTNNQRIADKKERKLLEDLIYKISKTINNK